MLFTTIVFILSQTAFAALAKGQVLQTLDIYGPVEYFEPTQQTNITKLNETALLCACNTETCPNLFCETSPHRDSYCYKKVEKVFNSTTGRIEPSEEYGCLSGVDNYLGHMQCFISNIRNRTLYVRCCNDQDYCNWALQGPDWVPEPKEAPISTIMTLAIICSLALIIAILIAIKRKSAPSCKKPIIKTSPSRPSVENSFDSGLSPSISSLKLDMEKKLCAASDQHNLMLPYDDFSTHQNHQLRHSRHVHQQFASNSGVTNTLSLGDDFCHKYDPNIDMTFDPNDLTSGVGEQILNPRTLARAIIRGQTREVGMGRYGRVITATYHGENIAAKIFSPMDCAIWQREEEILKKMNHENIVRFIKSEIVPTSPSLTENWMILEYCEYGSLWDFLESNQVKGTKHAMKIIYSIINGLTYLHEDFAQGGDYKPSIAHRDIKSRNILMRTPDTCCLADLGHACLKKQDNSLDFGNYKHIQNGTIRYMAPEILKTNASVDYTSFATFASGDIYQFALVMWEICHRTRLESTFEPLLGSISFKSAKLPPHRSPYDHVVGPDPDIASMAKIVCDRQQRPIIDNNLYSDPIMEEAVCIMQECWHPNLDSRIPTLGVKSRLKTLYQTISREEITMQSKFIQPPSHKLSEKTM